MAVVEILTQLVYLACALVSARLWWRARSEQAAWSAATFGVLGAVVAITLVAGQDAEFTGLALQLIVIAVLGVPWLLFRFSDSVVGVSRTTRTVLDVIGLTAAFSIVFVGDLPAPGETPTTRQNVWLFLVLGAWLLLAIATTRLLWHAGRGQPGVTRGRVRFLAVGALLLGLSVAASGTSDSEDPQPLSQALSMTASITFLLGFTPPRLLRSAWRAEEERALHSAAVGLLSATDQDEIRRTLTPSIRALLGAPGIVALDDQGHVVATDGAPVDHEDSNSVGVEVGPMTLVYSQSPSMPLFGPGEEELMARLSLLASLAAERVRFIDAERQARHRAEEATEALGLANLELEALNEELQAFVYTASHDLRNPIIAILGYTEVLREDFASGMPEEAQHYLERMHVNADFMQSLIRDLLELSRVGRVGTEVDDVAIDEMVATIAIEAERRHPELEVDIRWTGAPLVISANAGRMRQLFENLLENSCRYAGRPDVAVTVSSELVDGHLVIDARDNGRGIADDQLGRIFGMFERLDPGDTAGTGMGLAICRRIVESIEGTITALPAAQGAHFRIVLPAALAVEQLRTSNQAPSANETAGTTS